MRTPTLGQFIEFLHIQVYALWPAVFSLHLGVLDIIYYAKYFYEPA